MVSTTAYVVRRWEAFIFAWAVCGGKLSRYGRGKGGDNIKTLPFVILEYVNVRNTDGNFCTR